MKHVMFWMVALALLSGAMTRDVLAATDQHSPKRESLRDDHLPSPSLLLKRAIISNAVLSADIPEIRGKEAYQFHSLDIWNLLAVFDTMNSLESLRVLAGFASFRLGMGFSEMYECIMLRKGRAIIPYLTAKVTSGRDDCQQTLGNTYPNLCLSIDEYRMFAGRLTEAARAGKGCSDEEMENTFGF